MELAQPRFGLGISNCRTASGVVSGVVEAETLGAEIAFVAEDVNCRDAFTLLGLAAKETDHIRLSTGVVNPFTRNPTSLAMAVATLDEVSGGRAGLGLGASSPSLIEGQMGIPSTRSVRVMREATEIVRGLLRGETVNFVGGVFRYTDARLEVPTVQSHIPIVYAAMGPSMLRLAGAIADGVLLNVGASTEYIRWAVDQIAAGANASGRETSRVTVYAWLTAYITDDHVDGLKRAREWLAVMLSIPRQGELLLEQSGLSTDFLVPVRNLVQGYPHSGDRQAAAQYVPEDVAERLTLVGTEMEVAHRIGEYRDAGVDVPVLGLGPLRQLIGVSRLPRREPARTPDP